MVIIWLITMHSLRVVSSLTTGEDEVSSCHPQTEGLYYQSSALPEGKACSSLLLHQNSTLTTLQYAVGLLSFPLTDSTYYSSCGAVTNESAWLPMLVDIKLGYLQMEIIEAKQHLSTKTAIQVSHPEIRRNLIQILWFSHNVALNARILLRQHSRMLHRARLTRAAAGSIKRQTLPLKLQVAGIVDDLKTVNQSFHDHQGFNTVRPIILRHNMLLNQLSEDVKYSGVIKPMIYQEALTELYRARHALSQLMQSGRGDNITLQTELLQGIAARYLHFKKDIQEIRLVIHDVTSNLYLMPSRYMMKKTMWNMRNDFKSVITMENDLLQARRRLEEARMVMSFTAGNVHISRQCGLKNLLAGHKAKYTELGKILQEMMPFVRREIDQLKNSHLPLRREFLRLRHLTCDAISMSEEIIRISRTLERSDVAKIVGLTWLLTDSWPLAWTQRFEGDIMSLDRVSNLWKDDSDGSGSDVQESENPLQYSVLSKPYSKNPTGSDRTFPVFSFFTGWTGFGEEGSGDVTDNGHGRGLGESLKENSHLAKKVSSRVRKNVKYSEEQIAGLKTRLATSEAKLSALGDLNHAIREDLHALHVTTHRMLLPAFRSSRNSTRGPMSNRLHVPTSLIGGPSHGKYVFKFDWIRSQKREEKLHVLKGLVQKSLSTLQTVCHKYNQSRFHSDEFKLGCRRAVAMAKHYI